MLVQFTCSPHYSVCVWLWSVRGDHPQFYYKREWFLSLIWVEETCPQWYLLVKYQVAKPYRCCSAEEVKVIIHFQAQVSKIVGLRGISTRNADRLDDWYWYGHSLCSAIWESFMRKISVFSVKWICYLGGGKCVLCLWVMVTWLWWHSRKRIH